MIYKTKCSERWCRKPCTKTRIKKCFGKKDSVFIVREAVIKQKGRKEVFPGKGIFCFNKKANIDRDRMCPLQKLGK